VVFVDHVDTNLDSRRQTPTPHMFFLSFITFLSKKKFSFIQILNKLILWTWSQCFHYHINRSYKSLREYLFFFFWLNSGPVPKEYQKCSFSSTNHDLFLKKEHFWFQQKNIFSTIKVDLNLFFFSCFCFKSAPYPISKTYSKLFPGSVSNCWSREQILPKKILLRNSILRNEFYFF
jgi:hypothetical protein